VNAEPGSGWAIVGNQDLPDGYETQPLVIADSERMADCRPSLIAPNDHLPAAAAWIGRFVWCRLSNLRESAESGAVDSQHDVGRA
jgi:hypothetical protein